MRIKLSLSKKRRALTTPAIKKVNVKRQRIQFAEEEYLDEEIFQEKVHIQRTFFKKINILFIFISLFLFEYNINIQSIFFYKNI